MVALRRCDGLGDHPESDVDQWADLSPDSRRVSGVIVQQRCSAALPTVLWFLERQPGAVVGIGLASKAAGLFGPSWVGVVMFAWLAVSASMWTPAGERPSRPGR
jgi:hypothetical protein